MIFRAGLRFECVLNVNWTHTLNSEFVCLEFSPMFRLKSGTELRSHSQFANFAVIPSLLNPCFIKYLFVHMHMPSIGIQPTFHLPFSSVNIIDPPTPIIIQGITSSLWMPSNYWMKFLCFTSPSAWRCQGREGMLCHNCLACSIFNLGCRTTPIFLHNIFNYLCIYHFQAVAWAQAKPGQAITEGLSLKFSEAWAVKSQAQATALSPS